MNLLVKGVKGVKTTAFVDLKTLKFRKWFKYRLKAQKFQKQHALKGQKLLAQGSALGITAANLSPCFTLIEQALSVFFNVNYI